LASVVLWLISLAKGFFCLRNARSPGTREIEAFRGTEQVSLVYVKTAVRPDVPDDLSDEDSARINSRAARMGWNACLVHVRINPLGNLSEPIKYIQLV
jgi:hypothetical protein